MRLLVYGVFFFTILCTISASSYAQYGMKKSNQELAIALGTSNYLGDLAEDRGLLFFAEFYAVSFRPAAGIFYRNNFSKWVSFRTGINIGKIYGNDNIASLEWRNRRNLHFKSNIVEAQMMFEWNILPYQLAGYKHRWTPYVGIGIGGFYFNPKAEYNGRWVPLQPLGTEGQGLVEYPDRKPYSKIAFSIPVSFGVKWSVGRRWGMGLELQYNYLFTDYLDDVSTIYPDFSFYQNNYVEAVANEAVSLSSGGRTDLDDLIGEQRGNPGGDDAFFFIFWTISYKLGSRGSSSCASFR